MIHGDTRQRDPVQKLVVDFLHNARFFLKQFFLRNKQPILLYKPRLHKRTHIKDCHYITVCKWDYLYATLRKNLQITFLRKGNKCLSDRCAACLKLFSKQLFVDKTLRWICGINNPLFYQVICLFFFVHKKAPH